MKKKNNIELGVNQQSLIQRDDEPYGIQNVEDKKNEAMIKLISLQEKGVTNVVILGMLDNELMMIDSTFPSYEQIHALINRGTLELTMAHNKHIVRQAGLIVE